MIKTCYIVSGSNKKVPVDASYPRGTTVILKNTVSLLLEAARLDRSMLRLSSNRFVSHADIDRLSKAHRLYKKWRE